MGKPVAGDVVVVPFPQTDLQAGKRRPALVVESLPGDDVILCQITSRARTDGLSIPLEAPDFASGQLRVASFIRPNRLFTADGHVIVYTVGRVTEAKLSEVRARLREIFA